MWISRRGECKTQLFSTTRRFVSRPTLVVQSVAFLTRVPRKDIRVVYETREDVDMSAWQLAATWIRFTRRLPPFLVFAMKLREIVAKKSVLSLSLSCLSYFSSCFCLLIHLTKQMLSAEAFAHRETRFCYHCESYQLLIIFYLVLKYYYKVFFL